ERLGSGTLRILALHGWGRRGADFGSALEGLDALSLDLPGFGASPPPVEAMGAHGYARLVSPALDLFEAPPVVVGHSFGGRVAVCLAASSPDRIGPLVLSGVPLVRRTPSAPPVLAYRLVRALNRWGIVSDERLEAEKRKRGSADYRAVSGAMRDILVKVVNEDYRDELEGIRSEVTLLWGEEDREVPPGTARDAREIMERAGVAVRLEIIPGVGHHLPSERPQRLREAVEEMMR
ncbi:MAG: alpha/beta hydrolase, partial [Actinobacteria bacterium]|nr:alpha/beta hydrolase [Actinomycetota bacterium]